MMHRSRTRSSALGTALSLAGRLGALGLVAAFLGWGASPVAAASPARRATYSTPGYTGTTKPVPTVAAPLPTPLLLSSAGRAPDVLVDGAGTSHIVWITSSPGTADAVHYCRLPRGAATCDVAQSLVPQKAYGDGDDPSFNASSGARIVQIGQQLVIVDYRYPTPYPKPDGSSVSTTALEWVSEDGGASFTGPGLVGNQPIAGGVVGFGPPNDPRVLTVTDGTTGGTYVQALTPGQFTSTSANLGQAGGDQAYSGSLALDGGLPVVAFADLGNHSLVRRWTGVGSAGDASTWGSAAVVAGDEPKLAGGPGGLFMMNRPAPNGPYAVRRLFGASAGPPQAISDAAGPEYRAFAETASGGLVAGWESRGGDHPGVSLRASSDGANWSSTERLIDGRDNGQLSVAAAGDGGGIAVLNHTGGTNGDGQIVATAYGSRARTGLPGIAGVAGGGDPTASTSCQTIAFGVARITGELGCFLHGSGAYSADVVSDGTLSFNGLKIVPDPGVQIIIDPHAHTFDTTGKVTVLAEGAGLTVTLWHGEIHVKLPTAGAETDLFNFDMSQFAADLDGFPIDAKIDVKLTATGVRIPVDLKLPAVFGGITGHAEMIADSARGLHVDNLAIAIANAPIGPLLADFAISYEAKDDVWLGSGKLRFPPQPAGLALAADVAFARGHFTKGDIDIKPPGYGLPLFTDVYLNDIKGGLQLEPKTIITAGAGIGAIPIGTPTNFQNTMQINGDIALTIADPFQIEIKGDAALLGIPIADARLLFISNGYLSLDGSFDFTFAPVEISAAINAVVDLPHRLFSAEFKADFQVLGYDLSSVDGIVSTSGLAVCGDLPVPPFSRVTVGHHWNHDYTDLVPSFDFLRSKACDLSGYRVSASPARAATDGTGAAITLPHADTVNLAVHGAGAPPTVALIAPDGTRTTPAVDTMAEAAAALASPGGPASAAFTVPTDNTTVVVLRRPAAGRWHVEAQPGSAPVSAAAESHTLPPAALTGRVVGRGDRLTVRYAMHPRPGMTVRFAELAGTVLHVIGSARSSHGSVAFTPADGAAGRRTIVALVEQDGLPRPRVVIAHFLAPKPANAGRPSHLKLAIHDHTLTVTFGPADRARSYRIRIRSTDGKQRLLIATQTHRSARLTALGPAAKASVTVTAYTAAGRRGPPATATITARH